MPTFTVELTSARSDYVRNNVAKSDETIQEAITRILNNYIDNQKFVEDLKYNN